MLTRIAKSKFFDLIGILIVILTACLSGYLFETLQQVTQWGNWSKFVPFGVLSMISAIISLMSDRLTARLNNLGNWIGLVGIILSATVDYLLGNQGAIFTYPITFVIQAWAIKIWVNSDQYQAKRPLTGTRGLLEIGLFFTFSMIISFVINYMGFDRINALYVVTSLIFGLSLTANFLNAMKLTIQWPFWVVYNVIQLIKAVIQGNFANVGKYFYYITNSIAGLALWHRSRNYNVAR